MGVDTVAAERGEEGHRAPMALGMEPFADWCPSSKGSHIGLGLGLVDEDEPRRIKPALILLPLLASPGDRGPELFGGRTWPSLRILHLVC